ncbi:hypothetical protein [Curtobacterium sp. DN_7.5]|uniref:hypothetical protein n=1 Tax=Curtobacterium sp. DN_7.5 TaxID=3049047 RepID=UPI001F5A113C|nr:hypothetical protein [Curtobacterium sp. DN_7.5]
MTDTVHRAEQRWAVADARAQDVLALPPPRRFPVVRASAMLVLPAAIVLVVGFAFPAGSTGRDVVAWTGAAGAALLLVAVIVAAIRGRRSPAGMLRVDEVLLPAERAALRRVVRLRERAPEDRLDVVRAVATQRVRRPVLGVWSVYSLVAAGAVVAGSAVWVLWLAWIVVAVVAAAAAIWSAAVAQRYLDLGPS